MSRVDLHHVGRIVALPWTIDVSLAIDGSTFNVRPDSGLVHGKR